MRSTGNTIILCLSTAGLPRSTPLAYATTLVSLAAFVVGSSVTHFLSQVLGPLRRYVLALNFAFQSLCIILAAIVTSIHLIPTNDDDSKPPILSDPRIIGVIPALAFQSGATITTSRLLGYGTEIPVNVLTSTYAALATDERLLKWDNPPRNRRVAAVLFVIVGALCSAWIMKKGPGLLLVLWICAGVKMGLVGVVLLCLDTARGEESIEKS